MWAWTSLSLLAIFDTCKIACRLAIALKTAPKESTGIAALKAWLLRPFGAWLRNVLHAHGSEFCSVGLLYMSHNLKRGAFRPTTSP